jgi:riboflavin kinase/FMN adenylyltransferase
VTVFAPGTPPDELTPAPRKWRLLAEVGIERVVVLHFSRSFARVEADAFLTEVLGAGRGLRGIWIGHDFRFGRGRRGDFEMLARAGKRLGFDANRIGPVRFDDAIVSSTRIRQLMRSGKIGAAARLLGRWPDLEGEVVHGQGIGGKDLVATANLRLPETQCLPAAGVYAGEAEWEGVYLPAVMNLGRRPTLTDGRRLVAEVHVLDFRGDLRGRRLLFRLRERLRDERNFRSVKELRGQIEADITQARSRAATWGPHDSALVNGSESC